MQRLSELARALGAPLRGADAEYLRVNTDSRSVQPGDLFVALRGERFDAHDFVAAAGAQGAVGALVERALPAAIAQIVVADALAALQAAAHAWRQSFRSPLVAVTGSNGKTTTKQMLAAVFAARGEVLATRGNLNNHIGVPLTLLALREQHSTAVIEMGANHPGEIARLTELAQPDVAVITQAGDAHLEGFGTREGVARAKGELFAGLGPDAIAVINADDEYAGLWCELACSSQIRFGIEQPAEVRAVDIQLSAESSRFVLEVPDDSAQVILPLPGRHNVMNALAASACAVALGLDAQTIAAGLARVEAAQGRVVWKRTPSGARLIDDSYNANPTSMRAGLELLAQQPGQRWAVLGGMAELGPGAPQLHEDCGRLAATLGIERLLVLGPSAEFYARGYGERAERFADFEALAAVLAQGLALPAKVDEGITVLVKGSRSAGMERVVSALCGDAAGSAH